MFLHIATYTVSFPFIMIILALKLDSLIHMFRVKAKKAHRTLCRKLCWYGRECNVCMEKKAQRDDIVVSRSVQFYNFGNSSGKLPSQILIYPTGQRR